METSEQRNFSGPVFRSSVLMLRLLEVNNELVFTIVFQMPGSYYLLGELFVDKLSAIYITIHITH